MSNVYTPVLQQFMAQFFLKLRAENMASRLFHRDFLNTPAETGDVINVTLPTNYTATQITPGHAPTAPQDSTPVKRSLALDQWWGVEIGITDKQLGEIQRGVFNADLDSAFTALVEKWNSSIYAATAKWHNFVGAAGTNPFATDETVFLSALQILNENRIPRMGRVGILNPAAEALAFKIEAFTRADARGDGSALVTGKLGKAYGVDLYGDQLVHQHVSTPFTAGAVTVNGVQAVHAGTTDYGRTGTLSIAKATNASPLVAGDVLTITGDPQTYVVLANVSLGVGNTTVAIAPALKTATVGGEVITKLATHVINPVAHPMAISIASRPVAGLSGLGIIETQNDPQTGLALTVELERQHFQSKMKISALWGVDSFRPEFGVRMLG